MASVYGLGDRILRAHRAKSSRYHSSAAADSDRVYPQIRGHSSWPMPGRNSGRKSCHEQSSVTQHPLESRTSDQPSLASKVSSPSTLSKITSCQVLSSSQEQASDGNDHELPSESRSNPYCDSSKNAVRAGGGNRRAAGVDGSPASAKESLEKRRSSAARIEIRTSGTAAKGSAGSESKLTGA